MWKFSKSSLKKLEDVDLRLIELCLLALELSPVDFKILEGKRTEARQKELYEAGKSKTMNSKHLIGMAIDFCPLPVDWTNTTAFEQVALSFKKAAAELGYSIQWGGDWTTFVDCPHIELESS